jgi:hypothetical protein
VNRVPGIKSFKNTSDQQVTSVYTEVYGLSVTATGIAAVQLLNGVGAGTPLKHEFGSALLAGGLAHREELGGMAFPDGVFVELGASAAGLTYNVQYTTPGSPKGDDIPQLPLGGDPG